jgi:GLPGLI family protein
MRFIKIILPLVVFLASVNVSGQNTGSIVFERKTNLYKRFTDPSIRQWIKPEDQYKMDYFTLFFNDTSAIFMPQESDAPPYMSWVTQRHTTKTSLVTKKMERHMDAQAAVFCMIDSIKTPAWKITDIKRVIAGYNCFKAFYEKNDSTNVYAWFSPDLPVSVGPEGYSGLPGTILGLAAENGGEIYFATSVNLNAPNSKDLVMDKFKGKVYTYNELLSFLKTSFGDKMNDQEFYTYMNSFFGL